jgi:hypothetical protein
VRLDVQVVLRANASDGIAQTFYGLPGLFGALLPRTPNTTLRLAVAQPETACGLAPAPAQHGPHTALLAMRGNCSFADKAAHAQAAGATLLVVYDVQPGAPMDRAPAWLHQLQERMAPDTACRCSRMVVANPPCLATSAGCFLMSKANDTGEQQQVQAVSVSQAAGESLRRMAQHHGAVTAFYPVSLLRPRTCYASMCQIPFSMASEAHSVK